MNDAGYDTSIKYKKSHLEINDNSCNKEELLNRKRHYEMAIDYHTEENNKSQIELFSDGLKNVNRILARMNKRELNFE